MLWCAAAAVDAAVIYQVVGGRSKRQSRKIIISPGATVQSSPLEMCACCTSCEAVSVLFVIGAVVKKTNDSSSGHYNSLMGLQAEQGRRRWIGIAKAAQRNWHFLFFRFGMPRPRRRRSACPAEPDVGAADAS